MQLWFDRYPSPLGTLSLVANDQGVLHALDFQDYHTRMHRLLQRYYGAIELKSGPVGRSIHQALDDYFDGDHAAVTSLPVGAGGTVFQRQVWSRLRMIPTGKTCGYGELAVLIGRPTASRAVGLANGANPVAIVVPCHRVIGATGKLTGFGGGLWRKRWLLEHERAIDRERPILPTMDVRTFNQQVSHETNPPDRMAPSVAESVPRPVALQRHPDRTIDHGSAAPFDR